MDPKPLIEPIWSFDGISPDRQKYLLHPFEFDALIAELSSEIRNVSFKKDRGCNEAKGSWRPVIRFDVEERTFDRFFNSPYGYRGQFLIAPSTGVAANRRILRAITETLIGSANIPPALADEIRRSLLSEHAKIWIDEECFTTTAPDLVIEINVPNWTTAATLVRERLNHHDSTLTPKEIDRIYGVRAPIGRTLKVMGAWIRSDGALTVVPSKLGRAEDINAYGIS